MQDYIPKNPILHFLNFVSIIYCFALPTRNQQLFDNKHLTYVHIKKRITSRKSQAISDLTLIGQYPDLISPIQCLPLIMYH